MADTNLMSIPGQVDPVPVARDITPRADGRTDLLGLARERIRDLFDADEAEALLAHRVAQINVWRPISGPVRTAPLAVCDAQSLGPGDLVATDLVYSDRVGEIYGAAYGAHQRWYYFPNMERDEVLLIKGYDSADDGRARFTLHTAFDDPTSPPDAPARESIEVRTLAFFDS